MERDSIDRIRSATFPLGRRGYEKREVERFLNRLADWLETGGADQSRAELVRRDLERIGEQTGKILTGAHDVGERLRAEAEADAARLAEEAAASAADLKRAADRYASETRAAADEEAERIRVEAEDYGAQTRTEADVYSSSTRESADAYAMKTRQEVDEAGAEVRSRAERDAEQTIARAKKEAERIVAEANRRRREIEVVISDLEERRDSAVEDMKRLSSELAGTATQHRPEAEPAPAEKASAPGGTVGG